MTNFDSKQVRPPVRLALIVAMTIGASGCSGALRDLYGAQIGAADPLADDQASHIRELDLVTLLDPANQRTSVPNPARTDNEVVRALLAFSHPANNIRVGEKSGIFALAANQPPKCSETGRDLAIVNETIVARVVTKLTETRDDKLEIKSGKPVVARGKPTTVIDKVETISFPTRPKVENSKLCLLQKRMLERRNEIVAALLAASKARCGRYLDAVSRIDSDISFIAALSGAGLGAAGALFESAASAISAAAGAIASVPAAVQDSYFAGQSLSAVTTAIRDSRKSLEDAMLAKFTQSPADYPVTQMLSDVVEYHDRCSVLRGIDFVDEAVKKGGVLEVAKEKDEQSADNNTSNDDSKGS